MGNRKYIDFKLIEKVPNKYNIKPEDIKKLKVLDWDKLKKKTWYNDAMKKLVNGIVTLKVLMVVVFMVMMKMNSGLVSIKRMEK